ncbi:MAG TPA: ECF transporter S component, partial [Negativicutes bacterium]|nr:ECF transporter S component [Negativicutes bacterium]
HIPVFIAGLFLGGYAGLAVGALTPVFSSLLTGMPPAMPSLPVMAVELAIYGAAGGYLYNGRRWNLLVSLAAAMVAGRLGAALALYVMINMLKITIDFTAYMTGALVTGLPGIAIQLAVVPLLVKRLQTIFVKYVCKE